MKARTLRAVLETWQPEGRIERTIKTRWLPYVTERAFIAAARTLHPTGGPSRVMLTSSMPGIGASLSIEYRMDHKGVATSVHVELTKAEFEAFERYLRAIGASLFGSYSTPFVDDDGGGGEELPVPTISESELAAMMVPSGGVQ